MYWLYFARDFYRAGNQPKADSTPAPSAQIACVVFREVAPASTPPLRKRSAAKKQSSYVVKSPEVAVSTSDYDYLRRLSSDGIHAFGLWSEEEGFSQFSENFDRITGLTYEECIGHDWIHFIHHTQQYAVNEALLNALEGKDGSCLVQARRLKESAKEHWLRMDIKAASEECPHVMVMFCDLTEQKALEEALQETKSALEVSERSRSAFLSSMSHELRTPLNAIMGFSEMMKSAVFGDLGNATYQEYAKHIHESGNMLLTKINDLLDIASMEAGGLEIEEGDFMLAAMLDEALEIHSHHAFERQQKLHLDCPYRLQILGDRAKLMCAVIHLIANAIRHSDQKAEIKLKVRIQADEGVIISVHDSGEGIPEAQLANIRRALESESTYLNIEPGGIGLGLSVAKELAYRHGGRVMIDSFRHRGTVVSLILPMGRVLSGLPQKKRHLEA